jgi:hypothetical protein
MPTVRLVQAFFRYELVDDVVEAAIGPTEVEAGHPLLRSQLVQNLDFLWRNKEVEHLPFPSQKQRQL